MSRMVSDPGVSLPTGKDGILDRRLSDAKAPTSMSRMRMAQRWVARLLVLKGMGEVRAEAITNF